MSNLALARKPRSTSTATKAKIIEAAQTTFSTRGYAQSLLTEIAELADVSSPLIVHYFRSKEGLFEAALAQCIDSITTFSLAFAAKREEFGQVVLTRLSASIDIPLARLALMMAHSIGDQRTRDIAMRLIRGRLIEPLSGNIGGAEAEARAELIMMLAVGYRTFRMVVPAGESGDEERRYVQSWLVSAFQSIVTAP